MTNKEAIGFLDNMKSEPVDYGELVGAPSMYLGIRYVHTEPEDYAIDLAIKALEQQEKERWIPVSEGLPEEHEEEDESGLDETYMVSDLVLVTVLDDDDNTFMAEDVTVGGEWVNFGNFNDCKVIAWKPMPGKYEENKNEIR